MPGVQGEAPLTGWPAPIFHLGLYFYDKWLGAAQALQFTVSIKLDKYDIQH